jgi:predicted nucleotidyltransferase
VILEWVQSPIVYHADQRFVADFLALADRVAHRGLLASHYLHVAETQWERFVTDQDTAPLKKLSTPCDQRSRSAGYASTRSPCSLPCHFRTARSHAATFFREAMTTYGPN